MLIVGLTGGLATGKSTVLKIFREHGIKVIDADQIARKVLLPGTKGWNQVIENFGEEVLDECGSINRRKLGEIVFENKEKRKKLNAITHPKIQWEMMILVAKYFFSGHDCIVLELPLLFETGKMMLFMHKIITVVCKDKQQLERLCNRDELGESSALTRIRCQMPLEIKVANSDFVIDNSNDIEVTSHQTMIIMKQLKSSKYIWIMRAKILLLIFFFILIINLIIALLY
ncbi:unnamed protein product [Leptosia nina]|uniref:Dephospho-CoA kinase domain-containing protein n=1 Tax=Leptosia nina TaxID=320188 RepID=A0AAV1K111_9NEOP